MISLNRVCLLGLATFVAATTGRRGHARDVSNSIPRYPYDTNTTRWCIWWYDSDGSLGCEDLQILYGISLDFLKWVGWKMLTPYKTLSNRNS